ncbi:MAG: S8 family serine peptidase, partial [Ginsengibacter sp.]
MKYLSLSFCFFFFFFTTEAQQEKNFYYFGSKKVLLSQSTEKLYVRMKEGAAESKTNSLRRDFKLPEKAITTLQATNFMVINLNALNKNERTQIVSELKQIDGNIEISRPVLIAPDGKEVIIDEGFYLKLKQGITYQQLKNFATQKKCILNETPYKYDSKVFNLKAGIANNYDGLQMANVFFESGLFEYAEPDFRSLSVLSTTSNGASLENKLFDLKPKSKLLNSQAPPPNDPLFSYQWALKNTGTADQYNGIVGADINVMEAWDITKGDPLIKIAVIDEGIDRAHLDLISNIMPIGFGLVLSNATTGNILSNNRSHGTSCAGIIAAEANNNIGISGIAPLCKVIAVNITVNTGGTFGSNSQLANALDWSWNEGGADVLSNSWGGGVPSSLMKDAIHRAVTQGRGGKGSLVVFSSGNDDAGVSSPGIYSEVIGVGAMSMCYQRKSPSSCDGETTWGGNYGTALDISAPGVKIATTRVTGSGSAPNKDYNLTFNGTSSAAPMVSGVAALVLSINNNLTQSQVREILERTARKVGNYSYNFVQGQPNGSWSSELGHGMINAKDAVIKAQNPAFCAVKVATTTSLQVCSSGFVPLAVTNSTTGDTYTWRRDGNNVGTGISFNANQTGSYDVILNSSNSCSDTSYKIQVIVSPQEGQLVANAGRDTTISINAKIFLGGTPSGKGGTAIINPMRGFANDIYNNTLIRFDPLQPSMNFQIVKSEVTNDYTGAASTPFGLFMINKYGSIVKIDTANGNAYPLRIKSDVSINGMTYDATTGKIFAIGKLNNNILYEVNGLTGECTFLANVSGLPNVTISSISADNSGQLFGFGLGVAGLGASLIKINKVNGEATIVGYTGFQANYAQGGGVDPLTDELYQAAITSPFGNANFKSKGLWKLNKNTGAAILIGTLAEPYNEIDAVSFAAKEYKYQWSPVTNLSNPNDANPQFTGTVVGTYVYTLTVTDLCGNTTTDAVTIDVKCGSSIVYVNQA